MLDAVTSYLKILYENPLYLAIFGTTVTGVLLYLCRELPKKIFKTLVGMTTVLVEVNQSTDETAYECVENELHKLKLYYICGNFQLVYAYLSRKLNLNCAQHTLFLAQVEGMWCIISKYTDDNVKMWHLYGYSLRFLTRNKERVQHFVEGLLLKYQTDTDEDTIKIFKHLNGTWDSFYRKKLDHSCMQPSVYEEILSQVYKLRNNDKLGILLYGKPGCGKTHLIQILAAVLDRNIYYMNLSEFDNDNDFVKAMLQVVYPAIVLFEDIDCNNGFNRKRVNLKQLLTNKDGTSTSPPTGVTLSCLLNVFDGLLTQQGQFVVATTNHIEDLDEALKRTGRFDVCRELPELETKDILLFVSNYYQKPLPTGPNIQCLNKISTSDLVKICKENNMEETLHVLRVGASPTATRIL